MPAEIGYVGAFLGGLLALVSPCSAMLLPAFFAYAFERPAKLLATTGVFYLGLAATLVPMGAAASTVGAALTTHRDTVVTIGGATLIAFGAMQIAGIGFGSRLAQRTAGRLSPQSALSVLALGAVYGLAGFCAGPILGSVLAVAAIGGDPVYGGALLLAYALGMVVPLALLALLWDRLQLGRRRWLRGRVLRLGPLRTHTTSLVSGTLFIGIGLLFLLTDGTGTIAGPVGVDAQFDAQVWAQRAGERAGDLTVVAILGALLLAALGLKRLRRARRTD
ncbi:cytochrome c biogenesis CcdA family protein [Conexibacter arvalis]|uniref:Cytochrome c biogenesis protein CcdA n=1 Tax=Conexibacter arvalis TaxID=912552 RepID=A0A840IJL3_9ACTN|nr:cytochrome c biogenesis CcdA family protein [Conexibacter arvalis]MBB4664525.1 cytochrome c biogenesis protein CcdA [Conexibacter arvalis]